MSSSAALRIAPATERDIPLILEFIRDLAIYEEHLQHFEATEERIRQGVFGPHAKAQVLLAYHDDNPAGVAVYYYTFSTFAGLPGLYLEDLFVKPGMRGKGVGRALLEALARRAKQEGCWRIEWAVLNWNEDAIRFYKNLGAEPMNEWSVYRVSGESLDRLAARV
ncbi:MAG: GNAT family N-acetyltransferase, partial [Pyrinomonadaceae bacterium]